jgi:ankyrin repeat protein
LIEKGAQTSARDKNGYTPFHLASMRKNNDVAELLNPFPGEPLVQVCGEKIARKQRGNNSYFFQDNN